ncbi:MAG: TorF family putative porin [Halieaceae bacterium]|nr:TorF family putative porin [Halieaceae bacterium]
MFNKTLLATAMSTALMTGAALVQAQERDDLDPVASGDGFEISANVALTSDYRFRGISQSDESAAIQGGFDAEFGPGFYIGTWGSSVDFDSNEGYDGSLELDYYAGWSSAIGDTDFGIDVGYIYYDYPGDNGDEGDYGEVYVSGSWKDFSLSVNYSDDYYGGTGKFFYYAADYSIGLFDTGVTVDFHVGYNDFDENGFLSSEEDTYTDYSVSLGYSWAGVDFSVAYVGTDLDDDDVFGTDWADDTAVFTISKSM